jgi:outer membrane murein-binding lipoprotein Lpp
MEPGTTRAPRGGHSRAKLRSAIFLRGGAMRIGRMVRVWIVVLAGTPLLAGCVTVAEFRKLEREVRNLQQEGTTTTGEERVRLADLAARLDGIEAEIERANGRLEVAEHRVDEALKEARAARAEAAEAAASTAGGAGAGAARPDPAAKATRSVEPPTGRRGRPGARTMPRPVLTGFATSCRLTRPRPTPRTHRIGWRTVTSSGGTTRPPSCASTTSWRDSRRESGLPMPSTVRERHC